MSKKPSLLWIITGSIAAYKTPDMVRELTKEGYKVTCIMTEAAKSFVTPMTLASLSGNPVYSDLFSLTSETEMGHIRLSRESDLVVVAPATADIMAKLSHGLADDLASTILLASNKPIMLAPAMNVQMWEHKATKRNLEQCASDGAEIILPEEGVMACGEEGMGRMAASEVVLGHIKQYFTSQERLSA